MPTTTHFPRSFYIHIPFCRRRCFYCDFAITTGGEDLMQQYLAAISTEITLIAGDFKVDHPPIATLFFGGGTPSLFPPEGIGQLINLVQSGWGIDREAEISLEANPGTVTLERCHAYQEKGINRISLGAQAFQDTLLEICGRGHRVAEIYEAVAAIESAGIRNFNLDLISGLPQQTLADWEYSLQTAIGLQPTHISVYDLTIEPGTAFAKRFQPGHSPLPSESLTVQMYQLAHTFLTEAGYCHYEISNYCLPGYECRHNLTYWRNQWFYGAGMGATSYTDDCRWDRPRKMSSYLALVKQWQEVGSPPIIPIVSPTERLFDTLMQGLRLAEGIPVVDLYDIFPSNLVNKICSVLCKYTDRGWVKIDEVIRLCPLEGWLFSDVVIGELYQMLMEEV